MCVALLLWHLLLLHLLLLMLCLHFILNLLILHLLLLLLEGEPGPSFSKCLLQAGVDAALLNLIPTAQPGGMGKGLMALLCCRRITQPDEYRHSQVGRDKG